MLGAVIVRFALIMIMLMLFSLFSGCTENLKPPEDRLLSGTPEEQKCLKYFGDKAKDASKGNIEWDALCLKYESSATSVDKPLSGAPTPTTTAAPASAATVKATPTVTAPSAIMADATMDADVIYTEVFGVDKSCPACIRADAPIQHVSIGKKGDDMFFNVGLNGDVNLDTHRIFIRVGPVIFSDLAYVVHISENKAYLMVTDGFPDKPIGGPKGQPMHVDTTHPLELYNGGDVVVLKAGGLYKTLTDAMSMENLGPIYTKGMYIALGGPELPFADVLKQLQ